MEPQSQIPPQNPPPPSTPQMDREEIDAILHPLRTYERDIADMIRSHQASEVTISLAEQRRKEFEKKLESETPETEHMTRLRSEGISSTGFGAIAGNTISARPATRPDSPHVSQTAQSLSQTIAQQTPQSFSQPFSTPTPPAPQSIPVPSSQKYYALPHEEKRSHSGLFTALSIILIVIGIAILVWLYFLKTAEPTVRTQPVVISTFLPSNQERLFDLGGLSITQASARLSAFLDEIYPNDSITQIKIISLNASTTLTNAQEVSASTFFESVAPHIPASLTRAFSQKMFAGIYTLEKNHAFLIVQIDSFDKAFEGMLAWEKNMYADLAPFIHKIDPPKGGPAETVTIETETGGASSTSGAVGTTSLITIAPPVAKPLEYFEDMIVQNKDTRALRDDQGGILMIYSFIDQKTLFIVDTENTFREILKRYEASKLVR